MKYRILGIFVCLLLMIAAIPASESKELENQPPFFGTPTPSNSSTNNTLNLNWSIPINDPEGNAFSWTIQCSNTQTTSGTGALNGTKKLMLSNLAYLTTYKVWVNATDPTGSGLYTRKWYNFITKANQPPVFGLPNPSNGSTYNPLSFNWSIPINDPDENIFSWTIHCSNGQTSSGTNVTNGIKSLALSGLAYLVTYMVWVNATDSTGSGLYTRKWYTFTTSASPPPYKPSIDGPANGKAGVSYNYNFVTSDPKAYDVYYRIIWGDGSPVSEWYGPYHSGQVIIVTHTFMQSGTFIIQCQAKNTYNTSSDWGQLQVTMPVSINLPPLFHQLLEKLFERFPYAFSILRHLLGY
jgi:hypothetical protein